VSLLLRLFAFVLTRVFYRIRIVGLEHVPKDGGALLVPNHVSHLDWLFIRASIERPVRFLLETRYARHPLLRSFAKGIGSIPVSARGGPRDTLLALREAGEALDQGELVCIFAEGQVTRIGVTLPFQRGIGRVLRGRDTPVIPVHIDRAWGGMFSRRRNRLRVLPVRWPQPLTLSFGAPLPSTTPFFAVRNAVEELEANAWKLREDDTRPLHRSFIRTCRRRPFAYGYHDPIRGRARRFRALVGAVVLGRALRSAWEDQERVGILLPPSLAGALVNYAAAIGGRVAVNLNYTAARAGVESAVRQAGLRSIVTSKKFLTKAKLELPDGVDVILLEELARGIGRRERIAGLALAAFAPIPRLERALGRTADRPPRVDDVATIIFSSGSTGEPKGVELTHFNVASNATAVAELFDLDDHDRLLAILPLFHAFGYLLLWMCASHRLGSVFLPNPLDGEAVGESARTERATILVATPTFLQIYLRRCSPEQFASLRFVVTGAEKLPMRVADKFHEKFGVFPLEGYGATECSPVVTVNVEDCPTGGRTQVGSRPGTVGVPVPGVAVRIVDAETGEPCDVDEPGVLYVRGPNVMQGYLGRPDLTDEVLQDGWYRTGDLAEQDESGFVTIRDRLSRFSKIGGEMVPHGRVEEALQEAAGEEERRFAVAGVPDASRGESLAVLTTLPDEEVDRVVDEIKRSDLPRLWIPRRDRFLHVDEIPLLGTGKLDLAAVKRTARDAFAS